jgi:hypothetical protein
LHCYTPDFLVRYVNGSTQLLENKPLRQTLNPEFCAQFLAQQEQASLLNMPLILVTDRQIHQGPLLDNLKLVHRYSGCIASHGLMEKVWVLLSTHSVLSRQMSADYLKESIGPIINSTDVKISNLDGSIVQSLVIHSQPIGTQISLFNKYHDLMEDDEARYVLANLPKPFSEIKTGYNTPRLQNTSENQELVRWLDSRNIISSWRESLFNDEIKVNLYRR